jgi:hypothetical protein
MSAPIIKINSARETKGFFYRVCFLGLTTLGLLAFAMRSPAEKLYPVNDTVNGWTKTINGQEYLKQRIQQSDLPAKEVKFMIDSIITPLQDLISKQVAPPYQAEQKRIQDSVAKTQKPKQ